MITFLRQVLYGAVALVVLGFASATTAQADQGREGGTRDEWREHARRPHDYYYAPGYRYYAPGYRYYDYPRYRRYYGVPGYGYYRYSRGGGAVDVGPVHVEW